METASLVVLNSMKAMMILPQEELQTPTDPLATLLNSLLTALTLIIWEEATELIEAIEWILISI